MKVCIIGAGAIGGFIGTRLAAAGGHAVSAIARGATLAALQQHGWRLSIGDALVQAPCAQASADPREIGRQDLVVIAVKGPALAAVAEGIAPLLGTGTLVLPAMNGVPWWFSEGVEALGGAPLASVDPGGRIAASIPLRQVIGCVVHASTSTPEPGLVRHASGQGLIIGEPDGAEGAPDTVDSDTGDSQAASEAISDRVRRLADTLRQAGFDTTASARIRQDIWYKLWGNLTMNPVSAITGATIDRVLADPLVRAFCSAAMLEASAIGERIGCRIDQTPDDRQVITARLGAFKSSMQQDVEAGRPIELDSIVTAVHEMGHRLGVPTPNIDALLGLTRLFGQTRGLYPQAAT